MEWWNGGMECNDQLFMSRGTILLYYEPASMVVAIKMKHAEVLMTGALCIPSLSLDHEIKPPMSQIEW